MTEPIECVQNCTIPDGVTLTEVPVPRHDFSDVHVCPNDGCGRAFMTRTSTSQEPQ